MYQSDSVLLLTILHGICYPAKWNNLLEQPLHLLYLQQRLVIFLVLATNEHPKNCKKLANIHQRSTVVSENRKVKYPSVKFAISCVFSKNRQARKLMTSQCDKKTTALSKQKDNLQQSVLVLTIKYNSNFSCENRQMITNL